MSLVPAFVVRVHYVGKKGEAAKDDLDLTGRCMSFAFEDSARLADKVTVAFDNHDLAAFDDPRSRIGNDLEVSWGYSGQQTPIRRMKLTGLRGFTELQLEATGEIIKLDKKTGARTWHNKTRSQVVEELAKEWGFGTNAEIADTAIQFPTITQRGTETVAQFIARLAKAEDFEFYSRESGLHFHPRRYDRAPVAELAWYGGPHAGRVKQIDYSEDHKARTGKRALKGRDPLAKTPVKADGSNAETKRDGLAPVFSLMTEDARTGKLGFTAAAQDRTEPTTATTQKQAARQASAGFGAATKRAITMRVVLVGDPTIEARSIVRMTNVSSRLSGNWFVERALHRIDGSGYTTELELSRDGHAGYGIRGAKGDEKAKANVNDKAAKESKPLIAVEDARTGKVTFKPAE